MRTGRLGSSMPSSSNLLVLASTSAQAASSFSASNVNLGFASATSGTGARPAPIRTDTGAVPRSRSSRIRAALTRWPGLTFGSSLALAISSRVSRMVWPLEIGDFEDVPAGSSFSASNVNLGFASATSGTGARPAPIRRIRGLFRGVGRVGFGRP